MTYLFSYAGPGTVVCHGEPPLVLRIDGTEYPCADPAAEWCEWAPPWSDHLDAGSRDPELVLIQCVNAAGPSESVLVSVPEVGLVPGLAVGLLFAAAWAWVVRGALQ